MKAIVLLLVTCGLFPALGEEPKEQVEHLITEKSVGFIKFGMTIGEVRKILPKGLKLGPAPVEEGWKSIGVYDGETLLMEIGMWKDSQHVEAKELPPIQINDNQKISEIDIWESRYRTTEGVHVGMKVSEVEQTYGKFKEMFLLTGFGEAGFFTKQPEFITFVFKAGEGEDYAGIYGGAPDNPDEEPGASRPRAVKYTKGAVIHGMRITSPQP